jgi:ankyrin repeat protein
MRPIHYAAIYFKIDAIKALSAYGAGMHLKDNLGLTPFHYLIRERKSDFISELTQNGIIMDKKGEAFAYRRHLSNIRAFHYFP